MLGVFILLYDTVGNMKIKTNNFSGFIDNYLKDNKYVPFLLFDKKYNRVILY